MSINIAKWMSIYKLGMNIKTLLGNENEIILAEIAPHAMVRFHLKCKSCACACVASENQA